MNFRSDNTAPAAPEILSALARVNEGPSSGYGADAWSQKLDGAFSALFGRPARVFMVGSGTAANAIAIASLVKPWGGVLCHREAHIETDECGAPEFYTSGAKLILIEGAHAKLTPDGVGEALLRNQRGVHSVAPMALSLSQANERGCVYRPYEVMALSALAKREGLRVHMDGARFANAVAHLGCTPGEACAGVDVLSFGATKNGAIGAEAIVSFDAALNEEIERRRKRGGQLICKSRYMAAQFLAYIENDLWLKLARRANALAARIGEAAGAALKAPVETNQVFVKTDVAKLEALRAAGAEFYDWNPVGSGEARFVTSWDQSEAEVDQFCALLKRTL